MRSARAPSRSRPDPHTRRLAGPALATALLLTGWLVLGVARAAPAAAHAEVLATDPVAGSRLDAVPARVTVTFSEPVGLRAGYLRVTDQRGQRADEGEPTHPGGDGAALSVRLRPGLGTGSYLVSYAVVSSDSHPVRGAVAFVVGAGPLVTPSGAVADATGTDRWVSALAALGRWVAYAGLALLGALVAVAACWPAGRDDPVAGRLTRVGCGLSAAAALTALLLQGPYVNGRGLSAAFSPRLLTETLSTPYGRLLCLRLAAVAVLAVVFTRSRSGGEASHRETAAVIAGLAVLISFAAAGHAITSGTPTLAVFVDMAHLAAMSVWVGGLLVVVGRLLPSHRGGELAVALPRFSRLAFGAVAALAVSGAYQALREVGSVAALWSTEYGRLLVVKLAAVTALLAVAMLSRRAVRGGHRVRAFALARAAHEAGPAAGPRETGPRETGPRETGPRETGPDLARLRTSVATEVALAGVVLAVTALLVAQVPAPTSPARPFHAAFEVGGDAVRVDVTPARVGANTVRVEVRDGAGRPVDPRGVDVTAAHRGSRSGPLPVRLARTGVGRYEATGVPLPRPGRWTLTVRLRTSEFDEDAADVGVPVR